VDYLGHVIRPWQLSVAEKNTAALKVTKYPTTQTELRSFLGLCNVYRRFVRGFAKISAPLNLLLIKGETLQLGPLSSEQVTELDPCECYSLLVPRRYCKKTSLKFQRLIESRRL
jgi:hypothetical protein